MNDSGQSRLTGDRGGAAAMGASLRRVPCTVVTGFLGSGKTTLIRHLLEHPEGRRFAVLVNEFGDIGIDGGILKGCGVESCADDAIVELANGCICCTVADDFQPALETVLALDPPVDHILIETSGLALPKPLVEAFNWPAIRARVTVDGVVTVADGEALASGRVAHDPEALAAQRAADPTLDHDDPVEEVFEDQLACADLVILSKADLLDEDGLAAARGRIGPHLPPAVKLVAAANGRIGADVLLGLGAATEDDIHRRRTHHDDEAEHEHDDFDSFVVDLDATETPEQLAERVKRAGALSGVLRIKGFAAIRSKPMRLVLQAVGARVTTHYDRAWRPDEARNTRLVVIGLRGLDRSGVEATLKAA